MRAPESEAIILGLDRKYRSLWTTKKSSAVNKRKILNGDKKRMGKIVSYTQEIFHCVLLANFLLKKTFYFSKLNSTDCWFFKID